MKSHKLCATVTFVLVSILVPITSQVQAAGGTAKFSRGMIIKKDGSRFRANSLVFNAETLRFKTSSTHQGGELPLSEVEYVRAKTGTHALEGALIGGGVLSQRFGRHCRS